MGNDKLGNQSAMDKSQPPALPEGVEILQNQVAGHASDGKSFSILKHEGYVLKVATKPIAGEREIAFYEQLEKTTNTDLLLMKKLVPKFSGVKIIHINGTPVKCLQLDDLTKHYKEPCIMDVKIGRRTWDPLATDEKKTNEQKKYTKSKEAYGFCIPGFQVYNLKDGKLHKFDKNYGKKLDERTVKNAVRYFLNGDSFLCRDLVMKFLTNLWQIQKWARHQTSVHIYSSSLLLVYDARRLREISSGGNTRRKLLKRTHSFENNYDRDMQYRKDDYVLMLSDLVDGGADKPSEDWVDVKMIDFAHVFPAENNSVDRNYLEGIEALVKLFEEFLKETN